MEYLVDKSGDDCISAYELNLWALHQHILWSWGVYTMFRYTRMNVPQLKNQLIEWFVPADSTYSYEIMEYLKQELKAEQKPAAADWPGSDVSVVIRPFTGVRPYMDKATEQKIAAEGIKLFNQMLRDRKEPSDGT